jgi:hypothetical protein
MNVKEKIELEIRKTLDQFDNMEQLPPNPYFFTRLQVRLKEKQKQHTIISVILKPALLIALVALNLGTGYWYFSGDEPQDQQNTKQELVEILKNDLTLITEQNNIFIFE